MKLNVWQPSDIEVELVDFSGDIVEVNIRVPAGQLAMMARVSTEGRVLRLTDLHIQGLNAGALNRAGLNAIGRKVLVEADVDQIIIEGSVRTTGRNAGRKPWTVRFPN